MNNIYSNNLGGTSILKEHEMKIRNILKTLITGLMADAPVKSQIVDLHEKPVENIDSENSLSKLLKRAQYCSFT